MSNLQFSPVQAAPLPDGFDEGEWLRSLAELEPIISEYEVVVDGVRGRIVYAPVLKMLASLDSTADQAVEDLIMLICDCNQFVLERRKQLGESCVFLCLDYRELKSQKRLKAILDDALSLQNANSFEGKPFQGNAVYLLTDCRRPEISKPIYDWHCRVMNMTARDPIFSLSSFAEMLEKIDLTLCEG